MDSASVFGMNPISLLSLEGISASTLNIALVLANSGKRTMRIAHAILLIVSLLLSGCGLSDSGLLGFGNNRLASQPVIVEAARGPFQLTVLAQGELESSNSRDIVCQVKNENSSGIPIIWLIDEGTIVEEGDKLVELDGSVIEESVQSQSILVANALATVIRSKADVEAAEISLRQYLEGEYISERKTLLSQIALAEQAKRTAELNLLNSKRLQAKGLITELQIETDSFNVDNAKNDLSLLQTQLKTLDELVREKNRIQLTSQIESAKAKLQSDQLVHSEQQAELERLREQLNYCVLSSPGPGVVTYAHVRSRRSEFMVEEGATVRERQAIIKLPDPTKMRVKSQINESKILLVEPGQTAIVRVEGIDQDMPAKVTRVNQFPEAGNWYEKSIKEYQVWVDLVSPPTSIRTGMTAEVRVLADYQENALKLPISCVYEYSNQLFVLRENSDSFETVEISVKGSDGEHVMVLSGIEEGDRVVSNPRDHLDLFDFSGLETDDDREALVELAAQEFQPTSAASGDSGSQQFGGGRGKGGPGKGGARAGQNGPRAQGAGGGRPGGPRNGNRPNRERQN